MPALSAGGWVGLGPCLHIRLVGAYRLPTAVPQLSAGHVAPLPACHVRLPLPPPASVRSPRVMDVPPISPHQVLPGLLLFELLCVCVCVCVRALCCRTCLSICGFVSPTYHPHDTLMTPSYHPPAAFLPPSCHPHPSTLQARKNSLNRHLVGLAQPPSHLSPSSHPHATQMSPK